MIEFNIGQWIELNLKVANEIQIELESLEF